jgi:hypothetical protein
VGCGGPILTLILTGSGEQSPALNVKCQNDRQKRKIKKNVRFMKRKIEDAN